MKFKLFFVPVAFMLIATISCNKGGSKTIQSDLDSVSYCIGVAVGSDLSTSELENLNYTLLAEGFKAALEDEKNLKISSEQARAYLSQYFGKLQEQGAQKNLEEGKKFLDENKSKPGVITTASGLQYQVIKEGTGVKPTETNEVTVHYTGTLIDGTEFDSSVKRGQPATFQLNGVIPGWIEGLQLMSVGSKYKFFIPSDLAYGMNAPGGKIKPNSVLLFDVELLDVK